MQTKDEDTIKVVQDLIDAWSRTRGDLDRVIAQARDTLEKLKVK